MKKYFALFIAIIMSSAFALQAAEIQKVAVVNVQKVLASSSQVKALKKSQEDNTKEIVNLIKKTKTDMEKQTTEDAKKKLKDNLEKQLLAKKEANTKEYTAKLKEIDKNISEQIIKQATSMGYTLVLTDNVVLYGGDDITEIIIKAIK